MKFNEKILFLIIVLSLSLVGCGSTSDIENDNTENPYVTPIEGYDETYIIEPGTSFGQTEM